METKCYGAKNIKEIKLHEMTFRYLFDSIQSGKYAEEIQTIRNLREKEQRNELKKQLPYFTFSTFRDNTRHNDKFEETNTVVYDLDAIDNSLLEDLKEELKQDVMIYSFFVSPSGNGLKLIYKTDTKIYDIETYKLTYENYREILESKYEIQLDKTNDPARACFISYDPDIYFNDLHLSIPVVSPETTKFNSNEIQKFNQRYFYTIDKGKTQESRNEKLTSYAGLLHSKDIGKDNIRLAVEMYNLKYFRPCLEQREVDTILYSISKYEVPKEESIVYSVKDLFESYVEAVNKYNNKRVKTGIKEFDDVMMGGFLPGEIMGLCAKTGGFKTTYGLNQLINHTKETNDLVVYCSLEMSKTILAQRILQIETGLSGKEIWDLARHDKINFKKLCENSIGKLNIATVDKRFNIDDLKTIIKKIEDNYCQKVEFVCIDHAGLIRCKYSNEYDRASYIADESISIVKETDIALLNLYQVPREDVKMMNKVTLHSFKGSGNIENSLRYAITFNNINENNFNDFNVPGFDKQVNEAKGVSWINARLEKNTTGATELNVLLEVDRKSLKMQVKRFTTF